MKYFKVTFTIVVLASHVIVTDGTENSATNIRNGRVNGRIVKLYSGIRPDPIVCYGEGFQADPFDCSLFYRCIKSHKGQYTVYKFQCGPETVYDAEKETCNHPSSTKRTGCNLNTDKQIYVNDITNNIHEFPTPLTTKDPFTWGSKLNAESSAYVPSYIHKDQSYGGHRPSVASTIESTTHNNFAIDTDKKYIESSSFGSGTQLGDSEELCTSVGFVGDSKDCRKFYRCVNNLRGGFIRYEFACSDATIWDEHLQGCNHASIARNTRCGKNNFVEEKLKEFTTTVKNHVSNDIDYNENNEESYGSKVFHPPPQNSSGVHHQTQQNHIDPSNSENLTKPNLDSSSNLPYIPFNYDYTDSQAGRFSSTTLSDSKINNKNGDSEKYNNNKNMPTESKINDCFQNGFFGNKQDCSRFYRCVDNGKGSFTKYEFTCSDGTVWDENISACNYARSVKGCDSNRKDMRTKTTTPIIVTSFSLTSSSTDHNDMNNVENHNQVVEHTTSFTPKTNITPTEYSSPSIFSTNSVTHSSTQINDILNNDINNVYNQHKIINKFDTVAKVISNATLQNICQKSGFIGDLRDCKKFYRCVESDNSKFIQYEFSCGEGTVWDSEIESCNHAWAVKECGEKPDGQSILTNLSTNESGSTTQVYVYPYQPSKTTEINYSPTRVESNDLTTTSNIKNNGQSSKETGTTHVITTSTSKAYISYTGSKCDSSGFIGDVNDCRKFYRCVDNGNGDFIQYEFVCGENTVWDKNIQACNYNLNNLGCLNDLNKASSSTENQENGMSTLSIIVATEQQPQQINTSTKPNDELKPYPMKVDNQDKCTSEGFYADSKDCKKFYRCVSIGDGKYDIYEFTCGEGTVWVQEMLACDHEAGLSCNNTNSNTQTAPDTTIMIDSSNNIMSTSATSSTSSSQDKYPTNYDSTTTSYSTTKPISTTKSEYTEECKSEGFYGNKNDCKRFYRCVSDGHGGLQKYDYVCAEGTAWDVNLNTCNHIYNVPSCQLINNTIEKDDVQVTTASTTSSEDSTITAKTTTSTPLTDATTASAQMSTMTTLADSSTTVMTTTSTTISEEPTKAPSSTTTTLAYDSTTTSKLPTSTNKENNCNEIGFYGNNKDCRKFYRCVDDGKGEFIKYDFECGEGTIWDQDLTTCNHPGDVVHPSCSSNENTSSTSTTSKDMSSTNSSNENTTPMSSSSSTNTDYSSSEQTSTNKDTNDNNHQQQTENKNFTCAKAGFYANPYDCKKFYRCVDWNNDGQSFSIFHFQCGEGTIWDPSLETCNYEDSVYPSRNCSISSQNSTSSTTTDNISNTSKEETNSTTENQTSATERSTTEQQNSSEQTTSSSIQTTKEEQTSTEKSTTTQSQPSSETTTENMSPTDQTTVTDKTTTDQTTVTDKTTTSQTTISDKTTTDQTTVTDKTTTEQTSVTDKTTTDQTTVTDKSSTEQTAATDKTTTDQTTVTDKSTTEQTAATDKTTTDQTTVTDKTTTDQTTLTDKTTTDQTTSTTNESTQQTSTEAQSTSTLTTTDSSDTSTTGNKPTNECPATGDNQYTFVCPTSFRRHPKYCNMFYQCIEDENNHDLKIAVFYCPNNTIYDETNIQCVEESKSKDKCNGAIAQTHRIKRLTSNYVEPFTVDTNSYACSSVGYYPFERNKECSPAFLKCSRSTYGRAKGHVMRCPTGYVFWTKSKRCESIARVKDCKKSNYPWTNRYEIPREFKNVAP